MGFFDFFKQANINEGVEQFKATPGALLIDVRSPQEYKAGRIPGSKNVPLQSIDKILLTDFSIILRRKSCAWLSCWPSSGSGTGSTKLSRKTLFIMPPGPDGAVFIAHKVVAPRS